MNNPAPRYRRHAHGIDGVTQLELSQTDRAHLTVAIDEVLALLAHAEVHPSFPHPGDPANVVDDGNEQAKLKEIVWSRQRFQTLRDRIDADATHAVPLANEYLGLALGRYRTLLPEAERTTTSPVEEVTVSTLSHPADTASKPATTRRMMREQRPIS